MPLTKAFSKHLSMIGFDIDEEKIRKLKQKPLLKTIIKKRQEKNEDSLEFTADSAQIKQADFVLICVPTPVTKSKEPDLRYVKSAAKTVGKNLKKNSIVVLESTVYPGITEEIVKPILEKESKMKCGIDFYIGYSTERINPGDEAHALAKITKIVAGMDEETTDILAELYSMITKVYKAKDIKTAEAAKVIENIQRDLNTLFLFFKKKTCAKRKNKKGEKKMVCVVSLGYVGLPLAKTFVMEKNKSVESVLISVLKEFL